MTNPLTDDEESLLEKGFHAKTPPLSREELQEEMMNSPDMKIVRKYVEDLEDIGIITLLACMKEARASEREQAYKEGFEKGKSKDTRWERMSEKLMYNNPLAKRIIDNERKRALSSLFAELDKIIERRKEDNCLYCRASRGDKEAQERLTSGFGINECNCLNCGGDGKGWNTPATLDEVIVELKRKYLPQECKKVD